ncbi:hypothetical protein EYC80_009645 [Monilinia laxa]|uniref:Uncharacterized protein n=1 Tax=Monilinia laxa TaxID=61186 RepID=A0A5N6JYJ0_MONLA|nr:hypothetical protein EYC80_009645 [Monilinia laxa]
MGEPIICFNTDCNYPFGSACHSCAFEFELRAVAKARAMERDSEKEFKLNEEPAQGAALLQSRAESLCDRHDISQRVADIVEDLQAIFAFTPSKPKYPNKLTWKNLQTQDLTPASLKPGEMLKLGSGCGGGHVDNHIDVATLEFWLNEILENSLDGPSIGSSFIGGADEHDLKEEECAYCGLPMGEGVWKDLHLMKCKYAHEEAEKLESARAQWMKRRNC